VLLVSGFCMQLEAFTDMIQNLWFPKRLSKKCTFFVRRHTLILIADLLNWIGIYFTKYRPKRKINRQIGLYVKFCPLCWSRRWTAAIQNFRGQYRYNFYFPLVFNN
jgi:hypothetical protein